jgi:phosphatidate cytidylyltransferase
MLYWRLPLGSLIIAALAGLFWLDHHAALPGIWLMFVGAAFLILATAELSQLMQKVGLTPTAWVVFCGNLLMLFCTWLPLLLIKCNNWEPLGNSLSSWQKAISPFGWPLAAITICILVAFINEMCRFRQPGRAIGNTAASVFVLIYVGLLFGFLVLLRMIWGIGALASLIIIVKLGDTGAYLAGRLFGRHKLMPALSPGKTIEGACGAIFFACLGAWLSSRFLIPFMEEGARGTSTPWWTWILYGIILAVVGILGDLAESLIKRDAGAKDSSNWLPGFGGVLDILDSLLFAAPVGLLCWTLGLVA